MKEQDSPKKKNKTLTKGITKKPSIELYNADPNCEHEIILLWSGIKCSKCSGWFCA